MTDLHFLPGYAEAYARETKSRLVFFEDAPIRTPVLIGRDGVATHPYGYGAAMPPAAWLSGTASRVWWRPHPLIDGIAGQGAEREKLIAFMDLAGEPEDELRKGHRSSVTLAKAGGVTVEPSDDIPAFHALYTATMERLGAEARWRISLRLLQDLRAAVPAGFQILVASIDGEPEAACLMLGAFRTAYYHYAASARKHPASGAGNLLVVEAAHWAKARGYERLHLGGGTTTDPNDSLLRFKCGFSRRRAWTYVHRQDFGAAERAA